MRKRDAKSPKRNLINRRVINVVRAVQADNRRESGPGAESASGERRDLGGGGAGVDLLGAVQGEVGLDGVAEGDDGDLCWVSC